MNNIKWILLLAPCLLILFFACNGNSQAVLENEKLDSVSKDIPLNHKGLPIRSYIFKEKIRDKLHLELLENGFDSLQIRIWHSPAYMDSLQLVIIKYINSEWTAEVSEYKIYYNINRESIDSVDGITKKVNPKSNWQTFLNKLVDLGIITLPDISKINESVVMVDVGGLGVEVSTKSSYRFYHYLDPKFYNDSTVQIYKMKQIMLFIEEEFNFMWKSTKEIGISDPKIKPRKIKIKKIDFK